MRKSLRALVVISLIGFSGWALYKELGSPTFSFSVNVSTETLRQVQGLMNEGENLMWDFQNNSFDKAWLEENLPQVKRRCDRFEVISTRYARVLEAVDEVHGYGLSDRAEIINEFCGKYIVERTA